MYLLRVFILLFLLIPTFLEARYIHKDRYFVCVHVDKKSEKITTVDRTCKAYSKNEEFFTITRSKIILPYYTKSSAKCKSDTKDIRCDTIFYTTNKSATAGYITGEVIAMPFAVATLAITLVYPKAAVDLTKETIKDFTIKVKYFNEKKFEKFITKNNLLRFQDILKKEAKIVDLYPSLKAKIDKIDLNDNTKNIKKKIAKIKKEYLAKLEKIQYIIIKTAMFNRLYPFAKNPLKNIDINDSLKKIKQDISSIEKKLENKKRELIAKAKREKKIKYIQKERKRIKKLYTFAKNPLKNIDINDSLKKIKQDISSIEKRLMRKKNALKKKEIKKTKKIEYITHKSAIKSISKNRSQVSLIKHKSIKKETKTKNIRKKSYLYQEKRKKENDNNKSSIIVAKNSMTFGEYLLEKLPIFFIILFLALYFVSPKSTTKKRHNNSSSNSNRSDNSQRKHNKKENHSKQSNNTYQNKNSIEYACSVLGISINDSNESIKKRYKKLVYKYHPDIIAGKDLDEDFIRLATKKLQEINSAYDIVKKYKNIR